MTLIKGLYWWGYLDTSGNIHIKRYINEKQIWNCEQMPFCAGIFDPFEAIDARDAREKCQAKLKEMELYEKKS